MALSRHAPPSASVLQRLAHDLAAQFAPLGLTQRLALTSRAVPGRLVFTTSFGLEDQAITDAIFGSMLPIEVITLDTGRLFPETYELWARTEPHYGVRIEACAPSGRPESGCEIPNRPAALIRCWSSRSRRFTPLKSRIWSRPVRSSRAKSFTDPRSATSDLRHPGDTIARSRQQRLCSWQSEDSPSGIWLKKSMANGLRESLPA